jgi:hypothetical protein
MDGSGSAGPECGFGSGYGKMMPVRPNHNTGSGPGIKYFAESGSKYFDESGPVSSLLLNTVPDPDPNQDLL